jgi:hypothetical protein
MPKEVTRNIKPDVANKLWGRAAGRCQFNGCNRLLYRSSVTQEQATIAEKAHIYSWAENGPRGRGPYAKDTTRLNNVQNLLLVCHDCHELIDQDQQGLRYSAQLLCKWKDEHERRVELVTGIHPSKKSHVVLYGANIGDETSKLQSRAAMDALFPDWYPADERPVCLSMAWETKDDKPNYWDTEAANLKDIFRQKIKPLVDAPDPQHLSLFALAPMPLLVLLGKLLTDKPAADVYQLHREPQTWKWSPGPSDLRFFVHPPQRTSASPVLVISLSDKIARERVTAVLGDNVSIWEMTIDQPHNDFLRSQEQLAEFRKTMRQLMVEIGKVHGKATPIALFPAMPVACAIELGRIRMPKADNPWVIYDQNHKHKKFIRALEIGADHD